MTRRIAASVYVEWAEKGESNRAIARRFGVDEATVRRALASIGYTRSLLPVGVDAVSERFMFNIDKPLVHQGDLMITADWHIPVYDPVYVNHMITTAKREGLTKLLIAGDFFNFDSLSAYDPKQQDAGLERELDEAINVMRTLLDTFETVYFLWGNHDARLHRALGYKIQFQQAMRMVFGVLGEELLERVVFTNLDHIWIECGDEYPWYVCHPKAYNSVPLTGAIRLSSKMNANVITAHSHHCAVGHGTDGKKVVAEIGGLFDKDKTAYLQRTTNFPTWQQGFAWLKNGRLHVTSPRWTTA